MPARMRYRRSAAITALAAAPLALIGVAAPASAAEPLVATLDHGTLTVTGTIGDDFVIIAFTHRHVTVDFGSDGTIDATFPTARVTGLKVSTGAGKDTVSVIGTGAVPTSIVTGAGFDDVTVTGKRGDTGASDAPTTIKTQANVDVVRAATPGPISISTGGGRDSVTGGAAGVGAEKVSLGSGDDFFLSHIDGSLGARSDTVDAGRGTGDTMQVDGTVQSEHLQVSAHAGHLILRHNAQDTIDSVGMDTVIYNSFGGADKAGQGKIGQGDTVSVGDLTGAGLTRFSPDFSVSGLDRASDDVADDLIVKGTNGVDHIVVGGSGSEVGVDGLSTVIDARWIDSDDTLEIHTLDGDDTVDTSGLQEGLVHLLVF